MAYIFGTYKSIYWTYPTDSRSKSALLQRAQSPDMRLCQRASLVVGLFMVLQQRGSSLPASDTVGTGFVVAPACRCSGGVLITPRCNMLLRGGARDGRSKSAPSRGGKSTSQAQAVPADVIAGNSSSGAECSPGSIGGPAGRSSQPLRAERHL